MKCRYCKEKLRKDAIYCHKCSHYQIQWKNWLSNNINGLLVILALLGSFIAYSTPSLKSFYNELTWKDNLNVISLDSYYGKITILNNGYGDIYIDTIEIELEDIEHSGYGILNIAKKNRFNTFDFNQKKKGNPNDFIPIKAFKNQLELEENLRNQKLGDEIVFSLPSSPLVKVFRKNMESFQTKNCKCSIVYTSLVHKEKQRHSFECIAYIINTN